MNYHFSVDDPISEHEALDNVAEFGFHGLAFDIGLDEDELLHWHEYAVSAG